MMDELELLKKDWQSKEEHLPRLSYNDIYQMLWKKSSSIVKWILIISILEFTLPHLLYLFPGVSKSFETYEKLGVKDISTAIWIISYLISFYFIYQFYNRYKEISTLDNAKKLMEKIIRTRKTVKHYVIYSLSMLFVTCIIIMIGIYLSDNLLDAFPSANDGEQKIAPEEFKNILLWTMGVFSILMVAFMGGIYFLLYGLLLKKLNRNYKELKRLEV